MQQNQSLAIVLSVLVVAVLAISIGTATTSLAMTMMPGNQTGGKTGNMTAASNMTGGKMKSNMTSIVRSKGNSLNPYIFLSKCVVAYNLLIEKEAPKY